MSNIKKIRELQDCLDLQCADGNWNHSPYMHGMANGIIFAMSVLTGEDPEYLDPPDVFLCELEELEKFIKASTVLNAMVDNQDE